MNRFCLVFNFHFSKYMLLIEIEKISKGGNTCIAREVIK